MSYPNSGVSLNDGDDDDDRDSPRESDSYHHHQQPSHQQQGYLAAQQQPSFRASRSPPGSGVNNNNNHGGSFRLPPRNPMLDSFVNDAHGYMDPAQALSAAESRCVGLVASAESFAQQRHAKLQQLMKRIQSANNDEISDLNARVSICETALQELTGLLEQVQLHIGGASSSTREFIRTCTIERGKAEGRLLASLNAMLVRYEQQRRNWRQSAAQVLVRQDLEGTRAQLENAFAGLGLLSGGGADPMTSSSSTALVVRRSDDPFDELSSGSDGGEDGGDADTVVAASEAERDQRITDKISGAGPHMGFLSLEEPPAVQQQQHQRQGRAGEADEDDNAEQQQPKTPLRQLQSNRTPQQQHNRQTAAVAGNKRGKQDQQQQQDKPLLKYLPASVRQRRKSLLERFGQMLGQMLVDADSVDRPFLLDATYARIIRYADVLSLHGEVICRNVAAMFRRENRRRTHFLLGGERALLQRNAVALCPPGLVPIGDEPIYTVFVQRLVEGRMERELKVLTMMDSGLEAGKAAMQETLDAARRSFADAVVKVLATVTRGGVMVLAPGGASTTLDGSALAAGNNNNSSSTAASSSGAAGATTPTTPRRARAATFFSASGPGGTANGLLGGVSQSEAAAAAALSSQISALVTTLLRAAGNSSSNSSNNGPSSLGAVRPPAKTASVDDISAATADDSATTPTGDSPSKASTSSASAAPGTTEGIIRGGEQQALERVFARLLTEVSTSLEEARSTLTANFQDTIAAVQPSPINLIHNPTVFSLDSLQSELAHQALLLKVASTNEGTERGRLVEQLKEERQRANALQHDNNEKARRLIVLETEKQFRDAEMSEFEGAVAARRRTEMNLKTEVRKISYAVTADAFGKGWQESILLLRETMMKQMQDEGARLLARVKAYQKRKFDDQSRVVELLERGFVATSEQIDADHAQKVKQQQARHEVEMQRVRDECELRVKNAHLDAKAEIDKHRALYEELYRQRVEELNAAFDDKVRQVEMRQRDWEDRLWAKMRQIRADFREKEIQIEQQYAKKHEAVLKIYEDEANSLKRNISDKEALLESERLSVHLEIEKQIVEGIGKVKSQHERVRNELQAMMLRYLAGQRELFDAQRMEEMEMFSEFAFGGMQFAKRTAFQIVDENRKNFQRQIDESQQSIQEATLSANDVTGRLLKHRDELHDGRLGAIKANNEMVLRRTQLVRIEQDEKTWNNLHREIVSKGAELDKKQLAVETLMTQRYIDIVRTLHGYIQGDVSAAHQTFERECQTRQGQLRRYLNHFHAISLRIESELWREASARNDIEREALSMMQLLMSRSRTEAEYVVRNAIIQAHVSTLNMDAEETTFTTVEALRARYEALLRRQHQLMGAMSHDYVASLQHYVSQSSSAQEVMSNLFSARMDELHSAMRHRWELHWSSRDMLVEKRIEAIAQAAAIACRELLGDAAVFAGGRPTSPGGRGRGRSPPRVTIVEDGTGAPTSAAAPRSPTSPSSSSSSTAAAAAGAASSSSSSSLVPAVVVMQHQQQQVAPPLFFAQDVRVTEYFTAMRQLLAKTFADLEARILDGQEERERRHAQHTVAMRARFLEAAGALTRRAEQLEDRVLDVTMEANALRAQLQLKTEAEIRAALLADDLKALVGHYRLLTQNVLVHGAFNDGGAGGRDLFFPSARNNNSNSGNNTASRFAGASGIVPGGTFKRTHLLQRQSTNVPAAFFGVHNDEYRQTRTSPGAKKFGAGPNHHRTPHGGGDNDDDDDASAGAGHENNSNNNPPVQQQQQFQAMFLVDVGGKKATRDIVQENAALRERLIATEWKNDKFLRDALMYAHIEESLSGGAAPAAAF